MKLNVLNVMEPAGCLAPRGASGLKYGNSLFRIHIPGLAPRGASGLKFLIVGAVEAQAASLAPRGASGLKFCGTCILGSYDGLAPRGASGLKYQGDTGQLRQNPSGSARS